MSWFQNMKNTASVKSTKQQNQNVTVTSGSDVLYDIGIKLGRIDSSTNSTKRELRKINDTLLNHEQRLSKLENKK